ncbi:MAG: C40 family peptidase [Owenweeksia sp.]
MQYGVCSLSVVPMRLEPNDRSEMINQVLFGETFQVLEQRKKWSRIRLAHDRYEGWLDNKQWDLLSESFFHELQGESIPVSTEMIEIISHPGSGSFYPILLGSMLPKMQKEGKVKLENNHFDFLGPFTKNPSSRIRLVEFAYQYLNAPYLWGGRTPIGIDCSGFTQMVYRLTGYSLPRDSAEQARHGLTLSFIEESEPGDLAFFDNEEGIITHVGIILSDNYIIHASGKVRLDRLDQTGIFNAERGAHTHKLRVIKKII